MKAILSALIAINTVIVAEAPKTGCNETQERIVKRVEEIRGFSPNKFYKGCRGESMVFTDKDFLPAFFLTRPDGTTFACVPVEGEYQCIDPKDEEDALEAFEKLYSKGRVSI